MAYWRGLRALGHDGASLLSGQFSNRQVAKEPRWDLSGIGLCAVPVARVYRAVDWQHLNGCLMTRLLAMCVCIGCNAGGGFDYRATSK